MTEPTPDHRALASRDAGLGAWPTADELTGTEAES
jgi:hypothetical protein